jgi:hypothetical protein
MKLSKLSFRLAQRCDDVSLSSILGACFGGPPSPHPGVADVQKDFFDLA